MIFERDNEKSAATLVVRGFDFAHASRIFEGLTLQTQDLRQVYGEMRVSAVGEVDDDIIQVVFTDRVSGAESSRPGRQAGRSKGNGTR